MRTLMLLQNTIAKQLPMIHKTRLALLRRIVSALAISRKATLMSLGRTISGKATVRSNIKKTDRFMSNKHLHAERLSFYSVTTKLFLPPVIQPIIHVDWSCINDKTGLYLLRASISSKGRALVVYEECHPKKKENNHPTHVAFLNNLKKVMPHNVKPIIVTDAGFRAPWFAAILNLGWNFCGRLRNKNLVITRDNPRGFLSKELIKYATTKAKFFGQVKLTKKMKVLANIVLFKGKPKGRTVKNKSGKKSTSGKNKKYSLSHKEPWILVTSLNVSKETAKNIVALYKQRMKIEENFRDTKSLHFGLGLDASRTKDPKRMEMLLLAIMLVTLANWLAGIEAINMGLDKHMQSRISYSKPQYSIVFLGSHVIDKIKKMTNSVFRSIIMQLKEIILEEHIV